MLMSGKGLFAVAAEAAAIGNSVNANWSGARSRLKCFAAAAAAPHHYKWSSNFALCIQLIRINVHLVCERGIDGIRCAAGKMRAAPTSSTMHHLLYYSQSAN